MEFQIFLQPSKDHFYCRGCTVSYPMISMTHPSRNFFVMYFHVCVFLRVEKFESSVTKDFVEEIDWGARKLTGEKLQVVWAEF